jgi:hypothetical protein
MLRSIMKVILWIAVIVTLFNELYLNSIINLLILVLLELQDIKEGKKDLL